MTDSTKEQDAKAAREYDAKHGAKLTQLSFAEGKATQAIVVYLRDNPPRNTGERAAARAAYVIGQLALDAADGSAMRLTAKLRDSARKVYEKRNATSKSNDRRTEAEEKSVKRHSRAFDRACERAGVEIRDSRGGANNRDGNNGTSGNKGADKGADAPTPAQQEGARNLRKPHAAKSQEDALAYMATQLAELAAFLDAQPKRYTLAKSFKDELQDMRTRIAKARNEPDH